MFTQGLDLYPIDDTEDIVALEPDADDLRFCNQLISNFPEAFDKIEDDEEEVLSDDDDYEFQGDRVRFHIYLHKVDQVDLML